MNRDARDRLIVKYYLAGETQDRIGMRFSITRARVSQVLKKHKIPIRSNPLSNRTSYLGFTTTPGVKATAIRQAKREHKSVSHFLSDILEWGLHQRRNGDA